jgi:hypothetical protein
VCTVVSQWYSTCPVTSTDAARLLDAFHGYRPETQAERTALIQQSDTKFELESDSHSYEGLHGQETLYGAPGAHRFGVTYLDLTPGSALELGLTMAEEDYRVPAGMLLVVRKKPDWALCLFARGNGVPEGQ